MKKLLSLLLVLALCAALFAGCSGDQNVSDDDTTAGTEITPVETVDPDALDKAYEYLRTMYKEDNGSDTALDYTVVSQIVTSGTTFAIDWSIELNSGEDGHVAIVAGDDGMTTVQITTNYGSEVVDYNLVGTLTDAAGNTATVSFNHIVPISVKSDIEDGTYVIAWEGLSFAALDETYTYGYVYPNTVTADSYTTEDIMTITNVTGGVTIQDCYGRYMYMTGSYNSYNVSADMPDEGAIWAIRPVDGGYEIVNLSNNKTIAYSSSYASWGAYEDLSDDHNSVVTITAASADNATAAPVEDDTTEETTEAVTGGDDVTVAEVADGTVVTLYNAANDVYVTGESYLYNDYKYELLTSSDASAALSLTVKTGDGYVSLVTADGQYLYADGTNVQLVSEEGEYTQFVLETADGGYYIKCANATYNEKAQYLEIYLGYLTVYGFNSANDGIYIFALA